jgi:hypothetical protein
VEEVTRKLAEKAALFVEYTRKTGLSMNAPKTQLLFLLRAGSVTNTTVEVDGCIIHPGKVIELLGVKYDGRLTTGPHVKALIAAAASWIIGGRCPLQDLMEVRKGGWIDQEKKRRKTFRGICKCDSRPYCQITYLSPTTIFCVR